LQLKIFGQKSNCELQKQRTGNVGLQQQDIVMETCRQICAM